MKITKIRNYVTLAAGIGGFLALTFFVGGGRAAHANQGFAAGNLTGSYSFDESGTIGTVPFLGVGLLNMDGKGGISGFSTIRGKSADSVTATVSGTYVVNNDGTGSMNLQYSSNAGANINPDDGSVVTVKSLEGSTYNFVIGSANRITAIRTDGGELVRATFEKQQN